MDPRKFCILAERLCNSNESADIRTAISRAYYASYNVGYELLKSMKFDIPKTGKAHNEVQILLQNCGDKKCIRVGSQLGDLYSMRIDADYYVRKTYIENSKGAKAAVKTAKKMIEILDGCRFGPRREQIKTCIKTYLALFRK